MRERLLLIDIAIMQEQPTRRKDSEAAPLLVVELGRTEFQDVWRLQKRLVAARSQSLVPDCLLLTEHEPVITLGRGTDRANLLVSREELAARRIEVHEIERGGDITFHGPGQIVLYPIVDLRCRDRDTHRYLRDLERSVIAALDDLGLQAATKTGLTGIWIDDQKVGAIGVAVSRWITYHGVAVNLTTDLDYFKLINPCGITKYPVETLSNILKRNLSVVEMGTLLTTHFARLFGYRVQKAELDTLPI